jgi:multidrug resistance efflux pump
MRFGLTSIVVLIAVGVVLYKYWVYVTNPWTRDGQVRAQVIQINPRVSGPIVHLPIKDNQFVKAGELLFEIDPRTFQSAVKEAQANLQQAQVGVDEDKDQADRARRIRKQNVGAMSKQELTTKETQQPPAKAGGLVLRTVSPDTG